MLKCWAEKVKTGSLKNCTHFQDTKLIGLVYAFGWKNGFGGGQMTDYYAPTTFASIKNFCLPDGKAENLGHPICLAICYGIHRTDAIGAKHFKSLIQFLSKLL